MKEKHRRAYNSILQYHGQANADMFVLNCTNFMHGGYFLELGSRHPRENNNSYILEKSFGWSGVMVDREDDYEKDYALLRSNSIAIIQDATQIDYKHVFQSNNFPTDLHFLQLDLEVRDNTALQTLLKLNEDILNEYRFATITMEHDIYTGLPNAIATQICSREILKNKGYYCVFQDILDPPNVCKECAYEDWWVHPELVDMEYVQILQSKNKDKKRRISTKQAVCGQPSEYFTISCLETHKMEY